MSTPTLPNPDTLYDSDSPTNITAFDPEKRKRRKRRKRVRQKRKFRGIPAWVVFYATAAFMAFGLYKGYTVEWVSATERIVIKVLLAASIIIGGVVLFIDEKWSFSWSKSMRRSYQVRTNLTKGEIIVIYVLMVLCLIFFVLRLAEYINFYLPWIEAQKAASGG